MSLIWYYLKEEGMHGNPQDYGLDNSCHLLIPHHIMLLISKKQTKWLVLQTDDIIVSTPRWKLYVLLGNHFIQEANILKKRQILFCFYNGTFLMI
jgi:hypothetical protein